MAYEKIHSMPSCDVRQIDIAQWPKYGGGETCQCHGGVDHRRCICP